MSQDRFRYIDESPLDGEELIVIGPDGKDDPAPEGGSSSEFAPREPLSGDDVTPEGSSSLGSEKDTALAGDLPDEGGQRGDFANADRSEGALPSPEDPQSDIKVPFLSMQRVILVVMALLVAGFLVYFLCGCSSSKSESTSEPKATNKMILEYDLSSDKASTVKATAYDVTGDAKPDKVSLKPELSKGSSGSSIRSLTLKVNKKDALVLSRSEHPELSKADSANLKQLVLSGGQTYAFLSCSGEDGTVLSGLYNLSKERAKPLVTSYSDKDSVWTPTSQMKGASLVAQATDNRVAVTVDFDCFVTGATEATFDFVPDAASLALNAPEATNFGYRSSNAQSYDRPSLAASRSFAVHGDESLASYAFTVSTGDTCVLESLSVSDGKLKFGLKDGDKSGWIACPTYGYRTYFKETNEVTD